jgi:nitronate monooxygenase
MRHALFSQLRLPVIVAPMFLVSNTDLVVAACRAGVIGTFPSLNARTAEAFEDMLVTIEEALATDATASSATPAPYGVNLTIRLQESSRFEQDLACVVRHRVPLVITSVGDPRRVVEQVHAYGGVVLHDVVNLRHARKAADAGADGLILVCAGAGGHAGVSSPFAFVPQVRAFFSGTIVLAGAISDGRSVRAAQVLGADLAYMGTRFIATAESAANPRYKQMLVSEGTSDLVYTNAFSGVPANYLKASIRNAGMDPEKLPPPKGLWQPDLPANVKPWRDIWSAGQGVGLIDDLPPVQALVHRLRQEYDAAAGT